jgi:hypothetical protein
LVDGELPMFFSMLTSYCRPNIVRYGMMWYLSETFLQPRTERCSRVSRRECRTVEMRIWPETAVLSNSRLLKHGLNGITTFINS